MSSFDAAFAWKDGSILRMKAIWRMCCNYGGRRMHMIRKGQTRWVSGNDVRKQNQFIDKLFDLPA